jgi:hypothetical protein
LLHKQLCFVGTKLCSQQDQFQERVLLLIFPVTYVEALAVEEHKKYYQKRRASKDQMSLHKRHLDSCGNRAQNGGVYSR